MEGRETLRVNQEAAESIFRFARLTPPKVLSSLTSFHLQREGEVAVGERGAHRKDDGLPSMLSFKAQDPP